MSVATRRERERQQRRDAILAAAERVCEKQGLHSATMDNVAREAELSKGTLYLYFDSKEFLMLELATKAVADLRESMVEGIRGFCGYEPQLRAALREFVRFVRNNEPRCRVAAECYLKAYEPADNEDSSPDTLFRSEVLSTVNLLEDILTKGKRDGTFRVDMSPQHAALQIASALAGVARMLPSLAPGAVDLLVRSVCVEEPAPATLQASA